MDNYKNHEYSIDWEKKTLFKKKYTGILILK